MPQFYIIFHVNFAILATQRGGHGTMPPLNTPLGPGIFTPGEKDFPQKQLPEKHF